ncbi:MAG: acyltransferase [Rikenellaceae bacterium]
MTKIINLLVVLLPWCLKYRVLNKFYKYDIHPAARIGLSYVFPKYLKMEEGAMIGHLNVIIYLDKVTIGRNSLITRSNWITGFETGSDSQHFAHDTTRSSALIMGAESCITKGHHLDCTSTVTIGNYVSIGGYSSQIMSHSIDIYDCRQDSHPITIGDYCFVSTGVKILGGSTLPPYSALGAGAVLAKSYSEPWMLYGGVPAKPIKAIPKEAKYFSRTSGFVY